MIKLDIGVIFAFNVLANLANKKHRFGSYEVSRKILECRNKKFSEYIEMF